MKLLVFLIFLGSFQVKGRTFEHEKLDFLMGKDIMMDARHLRVKPCLPTFSEEWWNEFFITPFSDMIDVGPINVCFTLYPEITNCWVTLKVGDIFITTIDMINDILDNFGPHLELVWSSLQKWEPYLNGSFCNLQDSTYHHYWQTYDECEKCNNAEQDFLKLTFSRDMKTVFKKTLQNDFCHSINSTSVGTYECRNYVEDMIPRVYDWFANHILKNLSKDSVCRDHCSGTKLEESPKYDSKVVYKK